MYNDDNITEERILRIETRVGELEKNSVKYDESIKNFDKTFNEKLNDYYLAIRDLSGNIRQFNEVIMDMKLTMKEMQSEIRAIAEKLTETQKSVKDTDCDIEKLEVQTRSDIEKVEKRISDVEKSATERIEKVDEKGKLDWMQLVKDNLGKILFGGGLFYIVGHLLGLLK